MSKRAILGGFLFSILALLLGSCQKAEKEPPKVAENLKLAEHSKEFEKKIHKVADGVYSAVGYGIANVIMLVGKDGVIIIDTMTTVEEGNEVWNDLRKLTPLPLKAIIYTHFHPDHIFGASAFAGKNAPEIYAHESLDDSLSRAVGETAPMNGSRSMRMYGSFLDKKSMINVGIGPFLGFGPDSTLGYIKPTKTFHDRMKATVAGIPFEL